MKRLFTIASLALFVLCCTHRHYSFLVFFMRSALDQGWNEVVKADNPRQAVAIAVARQKDNPAVFDVWAKGKSDDEFCWVPLYHDNWLPDSTHQFRCDYTGAGTTGARVDWQTRESRTGGPLMFFIRP